MRDQLRFGRFRFAADPRFCRLHETHCICFRPWTAFFVPLVQSQLCARSRVRPRLGNQAGPVDLPRALVAWGGPAVSFFFRPAGPFRPYNGLVRTRWAGGRCFAPDSLCDGPRPVAWAPSLRRRLIRPNAGEQQPAPKRSPVLGFPPRPPPLSSPFFLGPPRKTP